MTVLPVLLVSASVPRLDHNKGGTMQEDAQGPSMQDTVMQWYEDIRAGLRQQEQVR